MNEIEKIVREELSVIDISQLQDLSIETDDLEKNELNGKPHWDLKTKVSYKKDGKEKVWWDMVRITSDPADKIDIMQKTTAGVIVRKIREELGITLGDLLRARAKQYGVEI